MRSCFGGSAAVVVHFVELSLWLRLWLLRGCLVCRSAIVMTTIHSMDVCCTGSFSNSHTVFVDNLEGWQVRSFEKFGSWLGVLGRPKQSRVRAGYLIQLLPSTLASEWLVQITGEVFYGNYAVFSVAAPIRASLLCATSALCVVPYLLPLSLLELQFSPESSMRCLV